MSETSKMRSCLWNHPPTSHCTGECHGLGVCKSVDHTDHTWQTRARAFRYHENLQSCSGPSLGTLSHSQRSKTIKGAKLGQQLGHITPLAAFISWRLGITSLAPESGAVCFTTHAGAEDRAPAQNVATDLNRCCGCDDVMCSFRISQTMLRMGFYPIYERISDYRVYRVLQGYIPDFTILDVFFLFTGL